MPPPPPRRPQSSPQVASGLLSGGKACPQNVRATPPSDGLAPSAYRSQREPGLQAARGNLSPTSSATELTPGSQHRDKVVLTENRTQHLDLDTGTEGRLQTTAGDCRVSRVTKGDRPARKVLPLWDPWLLQMVPPTCMFCHVADSKMISTKPPLPLENKTESGRRQRGAGWERRAGVGEDAASSASGQGVRVCNYCAGDTLGSWRRQGTTLGFNELLQSSLPGSHPVGAAHGHRGRIMRLVFSHDEAPFAHARYFENALQDFVLPRKPLSSTQSGREAGRGRVAAPMRDSPKARRAHNCQGTGTHAQCPPGPRPRLSRLFGPRGGLPVPLTAAVPTAWAFARAGPSHLNNPRPTPFPGQAPRPHGHHPRPSWDQGPSPACPDGVSVLAPL